MDADLGIQCKRFRVGVVPIFGMCREIQYFSECSGGGLEGLVQRRSAQEVLPCSEF